MAKLSQETIVSLEALEKEAIALHTSRKIQTEEGRHLCNLITRLIEVSRYGTTKTPPITTHNV